MQDEQHDHAEFYTHTILPPASPIPNTEHNIVKAKWQTDSKQSAGYFQR